MLVGSEAIRATAEEERILQRPAAVSSPGRNRYGSVAICQTCCMGAGGPDASDLGVVGAAGAGGASAARRGQGALPARGACAAPRRSGQPGPVGRGAVG